MAAKKKGKTDPRKARALQLHNLGLSNAAIGRDIGIHPATVRKWLRAAGVPPKRAGNPPPPKPTTEPDTGDFDELQQQLEGNLDGALDSAITSHSMKAYEESLEEDQRLAKVAEAQNTPSDKYQSYIAAAGIKMLRDSMRQIRGPRSIRELSQLDEMIRRNLGLGAKGGGGSGKISIDVSILNNEKADKGKGSVQAVEKKIIDADIVDE
jgi:transposase-like protein